MKEQAKMTVEQALKIIEIVTASLKMTLDEHKTVAHAIHVLKNAAQERAAQEKIEQ